MQQGPVLFSIQMSALPPVPLDLIDGIQQEYIQASSIQAIGAEISYWSFDNVDMEWDSDEFSSASEEEEMDALSWDAEDSDGMKNTHIDYNSEHRQRFWSWENSQRGGCKQIPPANCWKNGQS